MRTLALALAVGFLAAGLAPAAPVAGPDAEIFSRLQGAWTGSGTFSGAPATVDLTWDSVLGGRFQRLTVGIEFTPVGAPTRKFGGHGYYDASRGDRVSGHWFDTAGNSYPLTGLIGAGVLEVQWGPAEPFRGRSTYRLGADGTLSVTDAMRKEDGTFKDFSSLVLKRGGN